MASQKIQTQLEVTPFNFVKSKCLSCQEYDLIKMIFQDSSDSIVIFSKDLEILQVNESFTKISGYKPKEVIGKSISLLTSIYQIKELSESIKIKLKTDGFWVGEILKQKKDGSTYAEKQTIRAIRDEGGKFSKYIAISSSIINANDRYFDFQVKSNHDELTGLPKRELLINSLQKQMMLHKGDQGLMALVHLDIDGFRYVNDIHGQEIGDLLLIAISDNIKNVLPHSESLARIGGDEFAIALSNLDSIEATLPFLNRLLRAVSKPVRIKDIIFEMTSSIGVTFYPQTEIIDQGKMFRQADQSMYQAKLNGKNCFHIFDAIQDKCIRSKNDGVANIRRALENNEFILYYQPKVNMSTGVVIGTEALIRWQHPADGLLQPSVFLPLIDNHKLAIDLGEWVIQTALAQIETWHAAGLDIPISVNIVANHLQQPNFVERLALMLKAHPSVKPFDLEIEMIETTALHDLTQISMKIEECMALGVLFSIDDFGTGYSSITYLKCLPVSILKIDQSFVRGMLDDSHDRSIIEGIICMAKAFCRVVIAEGVETIEHGNLLLELGCELAQGYGVARPMAANKIPQWVQQWRPDPSWLTIRSPLQVRAG